MIELEHLQKVIDDNLLIDILYALPARCPFDPSWALMYNATRSLHVFTARDPCRLEPTG